MINYVVLIIGIIISLILSVFGFIETSKDNSNLYSSVSGSIIDAKINPITEYYNNFPVSKFNIVSTYKYTVNQKEYLLTDTLRSTNTNYNLVESELNNILNNENNKKRTIYYTITTPEVSQLTPFAKNNSFMYFGIALFIFVITLIIFLNLTFGITTRYPNYRSGINIII